jgi:eukaryotic-like serine/threonine-protein kinase
MSPVMMSFGRYEVLSPLAKTGAGERFLARSSSGDHHVVRAIEDAAFDEARRAAWLRHPNLVAVRELGGDDGRRYVATEYVHGEDLRRLLARVRRVHDHVPIAIVVAIGAAAAAGLHHAHTHHGSRRSRHGSVHGRLTASSILVGHDGIVKVEGLGIAAPTDASYLAPEQVAGAPPDRRSDVFALGVVLYELVTTRRLFRAPSDALTRAAIAHPNIPAPSRFRRGLPRALENIILRALAPAPADRFRTAGELRDALERFAKRLGMGQSQAGIADYVKQLFGAPPLPWLPAAQVRAARLALDTFDDDLDSSEGLGVAAPPDWVLRELGVPEARELEATPGRGTKTPMSWTSQPMQPPPPPPWTPRRLALMAAATAASVIVGYLSVGVIAGGGGGDEVAPMAAPAPLPPSPPPPPPPPLPPPPSVTPDASPGDGSAAAPVAEPATAAPATPPPIR